MWWKLESTVDVIFHMDFVLYFALTVIGDRELTTSMVAVEIMSRVFRLE